MDIDVLPVAIVSLIYGHCCASSSYCFTDLWTLYISVYCYVRAVDIDGAEADKHEILLDIRQRRDLLFS